MCHGDFAAYHERFHHSYYLETCSCSRLKSPAHCFFCPHTRKRWKDRWKCKKAGPSETIDWLLNTAAGAEEFSHIMQDSFIFKDICPNWARLSTEKCNSPYFYLDRRGWHPLLSIGSQSRFPPPEDQARVAPGASSTLFQHILFRFVVSSMYLASS
jgi:hypothetical protein